LGGVVDIVESATVVLDGFSKIVVVRSFGVERICDA